MATVTVDSTWLTNNGPAPYVLSTANTIYSLAQDVNVTSTTLTGEVFKLTGKNVQLNLNGHFVTLNGQSVPQNTDSSLYRRTSEATIRAVPANAVHQYGTGITFDGAYTKPVIDPVNGGFPPLTGFGQTS